MNWEKLPKWALIVIIALLIMPAAYGAREVLIQVDENERDIKDLISITSNLVVVVEHNYNEGEKSRALAREERKSIKTDIDTLREKVAAITARLESR